MEIFIIQTALVDSFRVPITARNIQQQSTDYTWGVWMISKGCWQVWHVWTLQTLLLLHFPISSLTMVGPRLVLRCCGSMFDKIVATGCWASEHQVRKNKRLLSNNASTDELMGMRHCERCNISRQERTLGPNGICKCARRAACDMPSIKSWLLGTRWRKWGLQKQKRTKTRHAKASCQLAECNII